MSFFDRKPKGFHLLNGLVLWFDGLGEQEKIDYFRRRAGEQEVWPPGCSSWYTEPASRRVGGKTGADEVRRASDRSSPERKWDRRRCRKIRWTESMVGRIGVSDEKMIDQVRIGKEAECLGGKRGGKRVLEVVVEVGRMSRGAGEPATANQRRNNKRQARRKVLVWQC